MSAPVHPLARALAGIARAEDLALALLLGGMIVLASLQIVLRNVLDTGLLWIGPLLRYMVLWLGLLGALCAARSYEHIAIDALARVLPGGWHRAAARLASAFTALVCGLVAYQGTRLVALDREMGTLAFGDVPTWCLESVIPICFAGMAVRYAIAVVAPPEPPSQEPVEPA